MNKSKAGHKEWILIFVSQTKYFKTFEVEQLLNIKSSRAKFLISKMVEEKLLLAIGENKSRRYTLSNKIAIEKQDDR